MKSFPSWRGGRWIAAGLGLAVAVRMLAAEPAPKIETLSELRAQIEAYVTQPRYDRELWGVKVMSLDSGRTLFEHHADRRLSPASNTKLYTAALALDRLGGDYRIVTPIVATAAADRAGEVRGNVIVCGRGDPSWNPRRTKQDFWSGFEPFVAALKSAGVRRIAGDLVADATYFREPPHGAGWTADDLNDYYGAEISAISLEENYVDLRVTPGATAGAPGALEWLQPLSGLTLDNRTVTIAAGGARQIRVLRLPGETTVQVFGELPVGGAEELTEATVPRPAGWFAMALKEALGRQGIRVDGVARSVRWPEATAVPARSVKLGEVVSPPLRELLVTILKPSQNLKTDLVFAHLGELRRTATTPAWRQSDELAVAALGEFLREHSLRADEVIFEEGSGLSRNNLTTAAATVSLLQFMAKHREAEAFAAALPVAGVDGSLRKRMKATPAEGNMRAKTGSLRWANALSGYVTSAAGERLAFSLMLNRHVAPAERNAREDLDDVAVMLARYGGRE